MWRAIRGTLAVAVVLAAGLFFQPQITALIHRIQISQGRPLSNQSGALAPPEIMAAVNAIVTILFAGCVAAWLAIRNGEVRKWRIVGVWILIGTMAGVTAVAATEGYSAVKTAVLDPYQQIAAAARQDAHAGIPVIFFNIVPRRPSMLYYAADYSPVERKEAPLLPYLDSALPPGTAAVDVVLSVRSYNELLLPEFAGSAWRIQCPARNAEWMLLQLRR
jgi:hypothetical protein